MREVSIKRSRIALVKGLKRELPTRRPSARHLVVRASAGPSGEIKVFFREYAREVLYIACALSLQRNSRLNSKVLVCNLQGFGKRYFGNA